jgi:hypothetical protein
MSVEKKPNEVRKIIWYIASKNLIKFEGTEGSYKLSDKVLAANDFVKFPLSKGDSVEVGIIDNTVTYLRKSKSDAPKQEPTTSVDVQGSEEVYEPTPEEEAPKVAPTPAPVQVTGEIKELTIFAVSGDKRFIKFVETKESGWQGVSADIQKQDYPTIGMTARSRVKVQINENTVISVEKVAVEAPQVSQDQPSEATNAKVESTPVQAQTTTTQAPVAKKEYKPTYNPQAKDDYWTKKAEHDKEHFDVKESDKQLSFEAQCALTASAEIVGRIAATISPAPTASVITAMVGVIAEANFKLIQTLKNK